MAININFAGVIIQKPGSYGPPLTPEQRARQDLEWLLASLGIRSTRYVPNSGSKV